MASLIRLKQIESGSQLQTSAEVGSDFSGAVYQIIDGAGLFSSSAQVNLLSASNYDGFVVQLDMTMSSDLEASIISSSISQSVSILSSTYVTTASLNLLSSSIPTTILNTINANSIISSSTQLDGSTLRNITIAPLNSDGYSLIVSGALAVVNATGLAEGGFGDTDSTVPAQIWLDGNQTNNVSAPPTDPSNNNQATANLIDMGEF